MTAAKKQLMKYARAPRIISIGRQAYIIPIAIVSTVPSASLSKIAFSFKTESPGACP